MSRLVLVTGGARSGKSRFAEARVRELAPEGPWLYVATAEPFDDEMRARIRHHREQRGAGWRTVEAPREPAQAIAREAGSARATLLDCVTLWLTNRMLAGDDDATLLAAVEDLAAAARRAEGPVVIVTNELGQGIVPESPLSRRFRDLAGFANQRLAAHADEVALLACGLPIFLKPRH
jgi:adenosylcobinamide kinase/adenosylcobinamide-phosphate guanylyltransferase